MGSLIESLESRRLMSATVPLASHFADAGRLFPNIPGQTATDRDIAVLKNGEFLVAGASSPTDLSAPSAFLSRYKHNGRLNTTFAVDGTFMQNFGDSTTFSHILVERDGSIVVTGANATTTFLFHFTAAGALDTSFGQNGKVILSNLNSPTLLSTASGIVVAGTYRADPGDLIYPAWGPAEYLALEKLDSNGSPVNSFGLNGALYTTQPIVPSSVTADSAGRLIIAGTLPTFDILGQGNVRVLRYSSNGNPDNTFGNQGNLALPGTQVNVDPQGRFIVSGDNFSQIHLLNGGNTGATGIFLNRYTATGRLDRTFGTNGKTSLNQPAKTTLGSFQVSITPAGITITSQGYNSQPVTGFYLLGVNGRFGNTGFIQTASPDYLSGVADDGNLIFTLRSVYNSGIFSGTGIEAYYV
jgi:uncharacterized delta-60 repeat protein